MKSSPFKILLVDDQPTGYLRIQDLLAGPDGDGGFALGWISAYDAAIQAVQYGEWDAILVTQRLGAQGGANYGPHCGLEFVQHARLCRADVPIILLSEREDHPLDYKARKAGATDCIAKDDFSPAYLKSLLPRERRQPRAPKKLPRLGKLLDFSIKLGQLDQRA